MVLKALSNYYAKEKQPRELIHDVAPSTSTPICGKWSI